MAEGAKSGNIFTFAFKILMLGVFLWILKVIIQYPEKRYIDVCLFPYKVEHTIMVDIFGMVITNDPVALIQHSNEAKDRFESCVSTTKQWDWLYFDFNFDF
jgi:hypothetical protein